MANEDDDAFWILKKEVDGYLELNKDNLSQLEKDTYTEEQYEAFDKGNIEKYQAKAFEWNGVFMDLSTICRSKDVVEPIIKTIDEFLAYWNDISTSSRLAYLEEGQQYKK